MNAVRLVAPADDLAVLIARASVATGLPAEVWHEAVVGVGGVVRAQWLIRECGVPLARLTPEAVLVAHVCACLLEVGPVPAGSPP